VGRRSRNRISDRCDCVRRYGIKKQEVRQLPACVFFCLSTVKERGNGVISQISEQTRFGDSGSAPNRKASSLANRSALFGTIF
jgi:hypothetical protein